MDLTKIKEFPISIYGLYLKKEEVLSKARARIFYRGENRNGSYISDSFAEKLIESAPYTPIKGIYENSDYSDHGEARTEGRVYGIVPETTNFAWETYLDEDGISREYACVDVLLFTAIYPEAKEIVGKSLSMELHSPTLKGSWELVNGKRLFVFTEGAFLGLQVLGEDIEPCFEGASFYTFHKLLEEFLLKYTSQSNTKKGGEPLMEKEFKLSHRQTENFLWNLLNPNFNEDGGWKVDYYIVETYDEYVLVVASDEETYMRISYTKDDTEDTVELGESTQVYIIDVTESERAALNALRELNQGSFDKVEETFQKGLSHDGIVEEHTAIIEEKDTLYTELETNYESTKTELEETREQFTEIKTELEALQAYKEEIELKQKEAIFARYANKLESEVLESYKERLEEFTILELDKELAYELVSRAPSLFEEKEEDTVPFQRKPEVLSGLEALLTKYEK